MQRYEYRLQHSTNATIAADVRGMASEGWRLAHCFANGEFAITLIWERALPIEFTFTGQAGEPHS